MPEWFKEWAFAELRQVRAAPVAVFLVLSLGGMGGWYAGTQFYAERLEVQQLRIDALQSGLRLTNPPVVITWPSRLVLFGISLSVLGSVALGLKLKKANRQVVARSEELDSANELVGMRSERVAELTAERDAATVALQDKKHEYAMETLERYSNITFRDGIKPRVTIRYGSYGQDHEIAMKLKGIFTQHVKWEVALDGSNNPALPRAEQFKVVFDVGLTFQTYGPLIHAISEGALLGVTVGQLRFVDREDSEHLIVQVRPSA